MPRVNVPISTITRAGLNVGTAGTEVTGDATNNHSFTDGGDNKTFLLARNSSGTTARNVTLVVAQTVDGQSVTNPVVNIAANGHKIIGPFPPGAYLQTDNAVYVNVDHADLRLQAFRVP